VIAHKPHTEHVSSKTPN